MLNDEIRRKSEVRLLCFLVLILVSVLNGCATTSKINNPVGLNIASITPSSAHVGEAVVISGTNFGNTQGSSTVKFNGTAATATNWSATSITVTVPSGATTGNVVVTVGGVASNGMSFTVTGAAPTITTLSPNTGAVGSTVVITGTNFGATQGTSTVKFNGTAATATSWSATSITVTVPSGATTGSVVINVGGQNSNGASFTISGAALVSIAVTPANASIAPGSTQQFTATGKYSDGSTQNLTNTVNWSSSALAVVTITNYGLASSVGTGSTTIQAGLNGITGSTTLTVSSALGPTTQSTTDTGHNNTIIFTPITIPSGSTGYTLGSFYLWVGTPANATTNVAIYTDNGGVPYQMVCNSTFTGTLGSGFVRMPTPTNCGSFTNAKQYWLANVTSSITQQQGVVAGACPNGGYSRYYSNGGITFPTTVGTTTQFPSNDCYSQNVIMYPTSPNSIVYWSAGSNGTIPTTSNLSAGTFGILGQSSSNWFLDGNNYTYTNSGEPAYTFQNPFSIAGTTYTGTGTYTLQYATNSSVRGGSVIIKIPPQTSYSIGYAVEWNIPDTDAFNNRYSLSSVEASGGADYIDAQLVTQGNSMCMAFEVNGGGDTGCITVHANTVYFLTMQYNNGGIHKMTLFDSSGTSLGTITHADQGGNYPAAQVRIGVTGAELESSGYDIWFGPVIINSNATFPVGP
jgi:IPT/TIG domain/Bacterial Ig-like domain (group 2)